ncbi:MAG TPA: kelch repeat-containing protein, partial [Gemmataceae bacterium]|nr:kelch repeat-containing protein [Gemmataceae bacterium]
MNLHWSKPITRGLIALFLLTACARRASGEEWTAKLRPEVNPDLEDLPADTWKLMRPKGDAFDHPKTEVGLVYDERVGGVVYFGGCSSGYCNTVWLYHVGSNTWKEILPWVKGKEEDTGKPIGQCGYGAAYNSDLGLYFKHRACSGTADGRGGRGRDSNSWTLDVRKRPGSAWARGRMTAAVPTGRRPTAATGWCTTATRRSPSSTAVWRKTGGRGPSTSSRRRGATSSR